MAGKQYEMAFAIGARLQGQFGAAFKSAQTSVASLQSQIESLNKKQGDIAAYQKQQQAIERTRAKLEMLRSQYANLKSSIGESGEASVELKNKMLAKELQIEKTSKALDDQTSRLGTMQTALSEAGVDTQNLTNASSQLSSEINTLKGQQEELAAATQESGQAMGDAADEIMGLLAAAGVTTVLKEAAEAVKACSEEAISFEDQMAGVKRTVGGSDAFLADLGSSFKELSTDIPITTDELTGIATTAGQLGIARGEVESFTTVMAQLATTTDLTADSAATMLAQYSNITGVRDYERLGSVVAELGDATATTAFKVVEMSQGMAAAASQAGMMPTDIMAIAAAVGSLGIEAQAGSTSMSTLISTLYKATETGEKLEDFASVAGMSASQFKKAWQDDAVSAMNAFIQGLNDTERNGRSAIVILDELGITNVRQTKAILGLASAGDLLSRTVAQANSAWDSNTALSAKAGIMYNTTQAKLTMLNNAFNNAKIAIGDAFTPAISAAAVAGTNILKPITAFIEQHPALIRAITAAAAVIGTVTAALAAYAAVAKVAAAASKLLTASIPGAKMIIGVTLAVAGLVAAGTLLYDAFSSGSRTMEELDSEFDTLNEQIEEQQNIIDLCERYKSLQNELQHTQKSIEDVEGLSDIGIELTAEVAAQLSPEDFVDGTEFELTAEQANELSKMDYIPDGTIITLTAKSGNILHSAGFLDGTKVWLTAQAANELAAAGYLDSSVVNLTAEPGNSMESESFLEGTEVYLTPEMADYLEAKDCLAGTQVQLTAKMAKTLEAEECLSGTTVTLDAKAANELALNDFFKGTNIVPLTPNAQKTLTAENFMKSQIADLTGNPQKDVNAGDFVASTQVDLTANFTNLEDLQQSVIDLQNKASSIGSEFSTAKDDLATMNDRYSELQARLRHASNADDQNTIKAEIDSLSDAISAQKDKVTELETAYTQVSTELFITSSAANELEAKEAELASVKADLIAASGGVITATGEETEAFDSQLATVQALAEAKKAELRSDIYDNVTKQAKKYSQAVKEGNEYQAELTPLLEQARGMEQYLGLSADQVNAKYQEMLTAFDQMAAQPDFVPFSDEAIQKAQEIQNLANMMGAFFDDLQYYADGTISFADTFGYVSTNASTWTANIQQLNSDIAMYGEAVDDANAVQKTFIDNLVNGVQSGAMTVEEVNALLTNTFASYQNGADLVAACMAEVSAALGDGADSSSDFAAGLEDVGVTADELNTAIAPIISQMEELGAAYSEAYDAAYESMDGQFDLFEQAPKITAASIDSMIEALQSQSEYMNNYAANLKEAATMGVSEGLLAQLSDGSTESAAYLAAIVADGTTKIDELNTAFAGVEEGKATFADTVANMETDFATKMAELQSDLETTIASMDMSADAAEAGSATVQAFADSAAALAPAVGTAFANVASAAKNALRVNIRATATGISAYASGTENAERGFAWVGENGPEIVWFNGGERVMDAQETASFAERRSLEASPIDAIPASSSSGQGVNVEVKPEYNISGVSNTEELRAIMEEQTARLRDMVEEVIDDIDSDRNRSVYA